MLEVEEVKSVASRACWKVQEEAKTVESRPWWSVASRACWKLYFKRRFKIKA